jgi:SAM-dependent methyltransferase
MRSYAELRGTPSDLRYQEAISEDGQTRVLEITRQMPEDPRPLLTRRITSLREQKSHLWALDNYHSTVTALIQEGGYRSILEIGGGRSPSLGQQEIDALGFAYTVNDISARELSLAPSWVSKALFDVQTNDIGDLEGHIGRYDLIFSNMVFEHVASFDRAYRNVFRLLAEGGVGIALHPVLFAAPFIVNHLLPDKLSRKLLRTIDPNRVDTGIPKFPAFYDGCLISPRIPERLKAVGFRDAWQVPFYGHNYYARIPLVRDLHTAVTRAIKDNDLTWLATYSYTIVLR